MTEHHPQHSGQPVDHRHKGPIYHTLLPEDAKIRQIYKHVGASYTNRTLMDIAYGIQNIQKESGVKNHTAMAQSFVKKLNEPGQTEAIQEKLKNSPGDLTPHKLLTAAGVVTPGAQLGNDRPADVPVIATHEQPHVGEPRAAIPKTTISELPPADAAQPSDGFKTVTLEKPVDPIRITSPFGLRAPPTREARRIAKEQHHKGKDKGKEFHGGDDLGAAVGSPVYAVAAGTVEKVVHSTSDGDIITIDHGKNRQGLTVETRSLDISTRVKAGEYVEAGQMIAEVAHVKASTGDHAHVELLIGGVPVNPGPYFDKDNPKPMELAEGGALAKGVKTTQVLSANNQHSTIGPNTKFKADASHKDKHQAGRKYAATDVSSVSVPASLPSVDPASTPSTQLTRVAADPGVLAANPKPNNQMPPATF